MEQDLECLSKAVRPAVAARLDCKVSRLRVKVVLDQDVHHPLDNSTRCDSSAAGPSDGVEGLDRQRGVAPD